MKYADALCVRDALKDGTPVIDGLATVSDAMAIMAEKSLDALIIDKRDEADEYGIICIHNVATQVISQSRNPDRVSVYEVMDKPCITLAMEMQVRYAIRLMSRLHVTQAITFDPDKGVGIVSLNDLVMADYAAK